jgi:hypothetical protein
MRTSVLKESLAEHRRGDEHKGFQPGTLSLLSRNKEDRFAPCGGILIEWLRKSGRSTCEEEG